MHVGVRQGAFPLVIGDRGTNRVADRHGVRTGQLEEQEVEVDVRVCVVGGGLLQTNSVSILAFTQCVTTAVT